MSRDKSGRFGMGNGVGRRFKPGVSGNPGGMPAQVREVRLLAAAAAPEAIRRITEIMAHEDARLVLAAAQAILDRAGVKPFELAVDLEPKRPNNPYEGVSTEELLRIAAGEGG